MIHEQIVAVQNELATNPKLIKQLDDIRDSLLEPDHSGSTSNTLTERLWHLLRQKLEQDLKRDKPVSIGHLASTIMALGKSIDQDSQLTANIESLLLDGIGRILDQHGEHLEIMIRDTVQDWDPHTLIEKLERQVGPDLQFIRINGTLIGGFVGLSLHAIGKILW